MRINNTHNVFDTLVEELLGDFATKNPMTIAGPPYNIEWKLDGKKSLKSLKMWCFYCHAVPGERHDSEFCLWLRGQKMLFGRDVNAKVYR